ncbi:hypothetical protein, partial [Okeania sp. SIO2C9]|uniref:hypothetical protein n=1 Tax=Okeania sp. SIO2C9 TaxID=2607791 RepID=UPI0025CFB1E4
GVRVLFRSEAIVARHGISFSPHFAVDPDKIRALRHRASLRSGREQPNFNSLFHCHVGPEHDVLEVAH